ncbi:hypothetical protein ACF09I_32555 [Streptomyces sp. NPDC014940]|uniref:hypothetical protein n=1 Tax=Streptomyces sp. NPDC014940 TaxID=3364932 RepID=UPI0036F850A7
MKRILPVLSSCRTGLVTAAVAVSALVLPVAAAQAAAAKPLPSPSQEEPASCEGGLLDGVLATGCNPFIQIL